MHRSEATRCGMQGKAREGDATAPQANTKDLEPNSMPHARVGARRRNLNIELSRLLLLKLSLSACGWSLGPESLQRPRLCLHRYRRFGVSPLARSLTRPEAASNCLPWLEREIPKEPKLGGWKEEEGLVAAGVERAASWCVLFTPAATVAPEASGPARPQPRPQRSSSSSRPRVTRTTTKSTTAARVPD